MSVTPSTLGPPSTPPAQLPSRRRFVAATIAIGAMQLMATMDGTIAVVALPKIQNDLELSDAGLNWVITAYLLTFGGLLLVGGRLGDTIGLKRAFIFAVGVFTVVSAVCGLAPNGGILIAARLLQGSAAAVIAPTSMALVATTFPKGPARNAAVAVFGATGSIASVTSLVVGGALTDVSWRLIFSINVPIGILVIVLAQATLKETQHRRMKLDAAGAGLTTLICTAAVATFSLGPAKGWLSAPTIAAAAVTLCAAVLFVVVERTAENPIVPFDLFLDRNRVATFATIFLAGGVLFTLTVLVTLYVQNIMGYSAIRAGVVYIPFTVAVGVGVAATSRLVKRYPPRVLVLAGGVLIVAATLWTSTLHVGSPYCPNLLVPLVIGGIGIGVANVPVSLSVIAGVSLDRIGPTSAISLVLYSLGGPIVMAIIQAFVTSRTLSLGGTTGPAKSMNTAQLHALDQGYTFGLLCLAGMTALVGVVALFIGYTAKQVAHAQEVQKAVDAGGL